MTLAGFDTACARLTGASRVIQWGGTHVWKVGPRIFALAVPGRIPFACLIKASAMARDIFAGHPGIAPAPYLTRAGWLRIDDGALPDADLADMIRVSHALVVAAMPQALRHRLGLD